MYYRTKTYIAADWDSDIDAVNQLHYWNDSNMLSLSFVDVHEFKKSYDSSLNCTIKASLKTRMDMCKTFILIVGDNTKTVRAGSCQYCNSYNSNSFCCARGHSIDYSSYIEYECALAKKAEIKIVVLYNDSEVNFDKCPDSLRYVGTHIPMYYFRGNNRYCNYTQIKNAIM